MTKSLSLAPHTTTVSNTRKLFCDHFTDGTLLQHSTASCHVVVTVTCNCTAMVSNTRTIYVL